MSEGGSQTSTTSSIPGWLQSAGQGYLQNAQNVAQQPYQPYDRQRVADLSPIQRQGIQGLGNLAGGTDSMNAADDMLTNTLQGGGFQNPYAQQGVSSGGQYNFSPVSGGDQYGFNQLSGGQNEYGGFGPQFNTVMNQGLEDIGRQYERFTRPGLDSAAVLNGTFGGGDHQRLQGQNEEGLAREMSRFSSGMLNDQYNRSAGLAESGLNRGLQAGQFNASLGNSAFEASQGRRQRAGEFNTSLGGQSFENAARRGLDAGQFNANLGSQGYENERNRQMQAVTGATGLASQRGRGFMDALNAGDTERRSMQSLLDSQYGDFREWRGYPEHQLGIFGNALSSLTGGNRMGSSETRNGPAASRVGQGIGMWNLASQMGEKGGSGGGFGDYTSGASGLGTEGW